MPIPRQHKGVRWLLEQPPTYDIFIGACASIVGFSAAYNLVSQDRRFLAFVVGLATIGVLAGTCLKHAIGLAAARKKDSTHELEGCLYTLHAVLDPSHAEPPVTLRLAVHVPVGGMLEQVTEYIGVNPKAGRIGRQFSANAGVIGKAYRENAVLVATRINDDYELYVRELVNDWNYTPDQAKLVNPAAKEWMAVPFHDPDRDQVEAVLFLDSNRRDFFTSSRQELVLSAVSGIAVFIGKRYS